jgi:ribose transport system substrate-binding protein
MTNSRTSKLLGMLLAAGLLVAACGSDDSSNSTAAPPLTNEAPSTTVQGGTDTTGAAVATTAASPDTTAAGTDTTVASTGQIPSGPADLAPKTLEEAQALVDEYSKPVTSVGVTEPISKKPDAGKKAVFVECNLPPCKAFADGAEQAAKLLGWDYTRITYEFTPEDEQSALQQAVDLSPDVIMSSGQTPAFTLKARQEMKDKGIIFIDQSAVYEQDSLTAVGRVDSDPAPPTVLINPAGFVAFQNGVLPASWAAVTTGGNVRALVVNVPDIPIVVPPAVAFKATLNNICPDTCSTVEVNATAGDIGTNIPSMVVSKLQEHPDTNYIYTTSGDFLLGVEAAVKAAGFNDVKIVDATPSQDDLNSMNSGGIVEATTGLSNIVVGWRQIDAAVRYFNGDSIPSPVAFTADDHSAAAWLQTRIYTQENAPESNLWIAPDNYVEIFTKLWNL